MKQINTNQQTITDTENNMGVRVSILTETAKEVFIDDINESLETYIATLSKDEQKKILVLLTLFNGKLINSKDSHNFIRLYLLGKFMANTSSTVSTFPIKFEQ